MQDFHVYLPKMMTKVQRIKRKGSKSNLLKYQICPPNDTLIVHRDVLANRVFLRNLSGQSIQSYMQNLESVPKKMTEL